MNESQQNGDNFQVLASRYVHRSATTTFSPSSLIPVALSFLLFLPSSFFGATVDQLRQKVGIYVWGQLPEDHEPLVRASEDAKSLGMTGAIRIAVSPYWDPLPDAHANEPLYIKIHRHDYWTVLNSFPVVMITAYDSASYPWEYRNCISEVACQPLLNAVRREFYRLAFELSRLPGTFILSNWESENDVPQSQKWEVYRAYLQARIDGIIAGRSQAKKLGYPGNIYTAFEFLIINGFKGKPSGLVEIGTKLKGVDFLSYSAWYSIAWDHGPEEMEIDFKFAADTIREYARRNQISDRLIIGEFGELWDMHPQATRMEALINGSLAAGVEYLFNWVAYDQPGETDEYGRDASHFGKYYLEGGLTPQGRGFGRLFGVISCKPDVRTPQKTTKLCAPVQ